MLRLVRLSAVWVALAALNGPAPIGEVAIGAAEPNEKPVLVFLLAGQSNMVGHGQAAELPAEYATSPANVQIFEGGRLRPLGPREGGAKLANGGAFGPEIAFGHEMARAMPERTILLVKHSVGGTSLAGDWNPKNRRRLYDRLLADYRAAVKDRKVELGGVLWSQGGADAKQESSAQAYAENLPALIGALRDDLDATELPFLIGGARPGDPASDVVKARFPHMETVRAAFAETEKRVPHVRLVSTVGLTMRRDGIHYDSAGQIEFGKRFARAMMEMRKGR